MAKETEQTSEGQTTKTEQKDEETVPMERFQEVEGKLKAQEEQNALLSQQMALVNANQKPAAAEKKPFDIYAHVGLDPEDPQDIPNQGQLKQIQEFNMGQLNTRVTEIQFLSTHPDYNTIVGTHENVRAAKFAPPLAKALEDNPALLQLIMSYKNPSEAAYQIGKLCLEKPTEKIETDEAKNAINEAVKNAQKVKSSSNATGGGVLSEAGRYESMSDEDFVVLARSHGAPI